MKISRVIIGSTALAVCLGIAPASAFAMDAAAIAPMSFSSDQPGAALQQPTPEPPDQGRDSSPNPPPNPCTSNCLDPTINDML